MTITAQLADGTSLEFPDGTDPLVVQQTVKKIISSKVPAFEREAKDLLATTTPELIAGSAPVRFALGAASPILGAAQLGAEAFGDKTATQTLSQLEQMKQRGMKAYGQEGYDFAGLGGAMMSPPFLAAGKLAAPASVAGKIAQGAAIGATAGAASPVTDNKADFWETKGGQTLIGMVTGGLIPAGIETAKLAGRIAKSGYNLVAPSGAGNILTEYQKTIIGDKNVPPVVNALRNAQQFVPGARPTAAEAVAAIPEGSPVIAHQNITAKTPGGLSSQFGQRKMDTQAALEAAAQARDAATLPIMKSALDSANKAGGIPAQMVTSKIDQMAVVPGQRASDVVSKSLNAVRGKIQSIADDNGRIDARDLYTVRKEIGNTIQSYAKESANWDKRLTSGLEKDIQKHIDDAIEASGGKGWKFYLSEYARRSQGIEAHKARQLAAMRPLQKTELGGGMNVAEETRLHLPQILSRPMMVTNYVLKKLGAGVEPRLDQEAARRYLDPNELADALEKMPPQLRPKILKELIDMGRVPAIAGAATAASQELTNGR